ncbi:hypothetical protein FBZ98_11648 [Rhizobium sp. ERR 922]|uniref:hypothetical protein n=1 Tax=unclassified Rhizobium TaxID=2613769 RepID=UPI0011ABE73C|nr:MULTISPECIES: hypothetical protein [unclassified Rhizobium]TWB45046.1 hypothetical protein FBZ98_11648 [Rhizobium sp. ERR 922]TWB87920.1 hypothetical protein FBZ97_1156 [Rhizobium sp. ERR 942]
MMAELAAVASDVMGREVRHITISDEEWSRAKIAAGMPAIYAEMLLGTFLATSPPPPIPRWRRCSGARTAMRDVLSASGL